MIGRVGLGKSARTNDSNLAAEALLAIIAVPSGLLTERRQTMTDDFMLYYNGFTVTTYRENGKETVQDAY